MTPTEMIPCPGCGQPQPPAPRYPDRFCAECLATATDGAGRRIEIVEDPRIALAWRAAGGDRWEPAGAILCRVAGQPAVVREARFGGLVAVPLASAGLRPGAPGLVDLRVRPRTSET